jgi:shikimate kinase
VRAALAGHTVIYLEITAAEGVRRTGGTTVRPLLAGPDRAEKFRALMTQRVPLYRKVATIRVNTNRRNPGAVVRHIVCRLNDPKPPGGARNRRRPPWRRTPVPQPPSVPEPRTGPPPTPATPAALAAARRAEAKK